MANILCLTPMARKGIAALLVACLPMMAMAASEQPTSVVLELPREKTEAELEVERWSAISVCFRCHDMSERTISLQPRRRQKKHRKAMKKKRSCLDCHNATDVACCHDNLFPVIDMWK